MDRCYDTLYTRDADGNFRQLTGDYQYSPSELKALVVLSQSLKEVPNPSTAESQTSSQLEMEHTMEEEVYERPRKSAKKQRVASPPATMTANTFQALPEVGNAQGVELPPKRPTAAKRVPPIVLTLGTRTHGELMALIKTCTPKFTFKYGRPGTATVTVLSMEDRAKVLAKLEDGNIEFHTFASDEERTKKTVIRGLPAMDCAEIEADLASQGFAAIKVTLMRTKGSPLYLAHFSAATDMGRLSASVKSLCYCIVRLQKYRSQHLTYGTQCYRCQSFGHASKNCHRIARCVKCDGIHATAECTKAKETPATCCNCGESHPANYTGCQRRVAYVASIQPRPSARSQRLQARVDGQSRVDGRSWAAVAGGFRPTPAAPPRPEPTALPPPPPRPTERPRPQVPEYPPAHSQGDSADMLTMMRALMGARARLARCTSKWDKMMVLWELMEPLLDD
jgi:hypothetical protein